MRPANKYGEETGHVRISGRERFAKYASGKLVGVFLAVEDTA